jgi:hypothetical protein
MTVVATPGRTEEFLRLIGDPQQAVRELEQAQESGRLLSSDHPRLIDEHEHKWVALHGGTVIAEADSIDDLLTELDPETRSHVLVRFIDRHEQTLIL